MKRIVPVAVGLAAGMAAGFFLGAMVTRHGGPTVVIHNATDKTLPGVSITTDFHKSYHIHGGYIPEVEGYFIDKLQPHETLIDRMLSHRPMALTVRATSRGLCTHIGQSLGVPDTVAFQQALQGRRGQLARIVAVDGEGFIRVGDPVTLLTSSDLTPV